MLTLTPIITQNFNTFPNQNPIGAPWETLAYRGGATCLQIASGVAECAPPVAEFVNFQMLSTSLPPDQYASMTIAHSNVNSQPDSCIMLRATDVGSGFPNGYELCLENQIAFVAFYLARVTNSNQDILVQVNNLTYTDGDTFTFAVVGSTLYGFQNGNLLITATDTTYTSGGAALGAYIDNSSGLPTDLQYSSFVAGSASSGSTYSIGGNAGVGGATVAYSGTASGSVIADGSGNYTISGLANGSYTITPSLAGYTFSPVSRSETVSSSNITGANFTAASSSAWSQPDCRNYGNFPNDAVNVQGTLQYTVPSVDSRKAGALVDSRKNKPVDSRVNKPLNSRTSQK